MHTKYGFVNMADRWFSWNSLWLLCAVCVHIGIFLNEL